MLRLIRFAICALVFLPLAVMAGGRDDASDLRRLLAPMENISANFEQILTGPDGHVIQRARGEMAVARPGKVYWHSEAPFEQLIVSDAETLWIYDPDLAQVTVRPFQRNIRRTPAILFIGEVGDLEAEYRVSAEQLTDNETLYRLEPRGGDSLFESIAIRFAGGRPSSMVLRDSMGQETRIELSGVEINGDIASSRFQFEPPAGVDILRDD
jgi:outer membrane lipoprotein carrier protein